MKSPSCIATGIAEPEYVDAFMQELKYPLKDVIQSLREIILSASPAIGQGIFYNAPAFFYTGKMEAFNPKEFKRYLVGFNLFQTDCVRLIFLRGAEVSNNAGLLTGDYKDGRRLAHFKSIADVEKNKENLIQILKQLLQLIE
jgi:hypothetical protein